MTKHNLDFTGVMEGQIWAVWNAAASYLRPALGEGETLEQVLLDLMSQKAQLWIAATDTKLHAVCVTELVRRGGNLYCNVWLSGGDGVNNWVHFLETIEAWAKERGCIAMTIDRARPGWKRLLKAYKIKTVTLVKDI